MTGSSTAICEFELGATAPEWVQLFPAGEMTGRDGRRFNLADAHAVISDFRSRGVGLPVDYEHQSDADPDTRSGPVPAAGWIKDLKADDTGLWGRVEWADQARELILGRAYRYISPSFYCRKVGNVITRLKGAGLVHNPNLHLKALASEENGMTENGQILGKLLALLGLPDDTAEEELFDTIEELVKKAVSMATAAQALSSDIEQLQAHLTSPDPARFVPIEAVLDLMKDRSSERAGQIGERAEAKVRGALDKGHITSRMKGLGDGTVFAGRGQFRRLSGKLRSGL